MNSGNSQRRRLVKSSLISSTLVFAAVVASTASAQTQLRFSHTDQPGGARNAAALLFELIPMMLATLLVVILITYVPALPMALVWWLR